MTDTTVTAATRAIFLEYAGKQLHTERAAAIQMWEGDPDLQATWETHARRIVAAYANELRDDAADGLKTLARVLYLDYMTQAQGCERGESREDWKTHKDVRKQWRQHARNVAGSFVAELVLTSV